LGGSIQTSQEDGKSGQPTAKDFVNATKPSIRLFQKRQKPFESSFCFIFTPDQLLPQEVGLLVSDRFILLSARLFFKHQFDILAG
jgi:hypothetical protein